MLIDAFAMTTLRKLRRYARFVFFVGVTASLGANYLHAPQKATAVATAIAAGIAMWPSIALLLGTELVIRVPMKGAAATLVVARVIGTFVVSVIAGWVSYRHMQAVSAEYGEGAGLNANLFPWSVDGLMVVAAVTLVQLNFMILMKAHKEFLATQPATDEAAVVQISQGSIVEPVQPQQQPVPVVVQRAASTEDTETLTPQALARLKPSERVEYVIKMHPTVTQVNALAYLAGVSASTVSKYLKARPQTSETPVRPEVTTDYVPAPAEYVHPNGHQS